MKTSRVSLVIDDGMLELPAGPVVVFRPTAETDLTAFAVENVFFDQTFFPDHQALSSYGYSPVHPDMTSELALVCPTRSKVESRGLIARACQAAVGGIVVVDGQKTDGIESLYKDVKKRVPIAGMLSKSHGRIFWFEASDAFSDWVVPSSKTQAHGFITTPGIFSPDAIDKGSAVLVECMPQLKGRIADLGAGWGFIAANLANQEKISELHLIEAEKHALDCAKLNVTDPRAQFHWADATQFKYAEPFNFVVSNPPFHTSRSANPDIGRNFIRSAAALLSTSGTLIMVANRHLPYEATLTECFRDITEIGGNAGFKVISASRPSRAKR